MSVLTVLGRGRPLLLAIAVLALTARPLRAVLVPVTAPDLERAVALGRHPDAERARFHRRYLVAVNGPPVDAWAVEQIETITEFRRIELMAEEHARLNDLWGRGGFMEVERDIAPWRNKVSIVARLGLRPTMAYVAGVPTVEITLSGPAVERLDLRGTPLYTACGEVVGCGITGGLVEYVVDAASIAQSTRTINVTLDNRALASVTVDFANLE